MRKKSPSSGKTSIEEKGIPLVFHIDAGSQKKGPFRSVELLGEDGGPGAAAEPALEERAETGAGFPRNAGHLQ